jgi:hypothetical protein
MPKRLVTLAIVAFWLGMAGLFAYETLWPRFMPSEPLMFPVDVVDEAGTQSETANWDITKNGTTGYRADVEWRYHREDDTFESECELAWRIPGEKDWKDFGGHHVMLQTLGGYGLAPGGVPVGALVQCGAASQVLRADTLAVKWELPRRESLPGLPQVHDVNIKRSTYRLTRQGEMKSLTVTSSYELLWGSDQGTGIKVEAQVSGSIQSRRFAPHVKLSFPELRGEEKIGPLSLQNFEGDGAPVAVLERGTVLNPLHPPRRLPDLSDGQRWRVVVIDPLALLGLIAPLDRALGGALREAGIAADAGAEVLDARVLPGTQMVDWEGGKDVPCRVVRCTGEGAVKSLILWARERDGLMMRQEVSLWGDSWTFLRLPHGHPMRYPPRQHKKAL